MKKKIKRISKLGWVGILLTGIAFAILIPVVLSEFAGLNTIAPWLLAKEVSNEISIELFSDGVAGEAEYTAQSYGALVGIIFFLILAPGLFVLYGFDSKEGESGERMKGSFFVFIAGIVLMISSLFWFGAETIIGTIVQENSKDSASRTALKDEIRHNLSTLGIQSYEYLVLPEEYGGGGGSFEGLVIEDLPAYGDIQKGEYRFAETTSDTLLRITGTTGPELTGENTEKGATELILQVYPSDILHWEKNN